MSASVVIARCKTCGLRREWERPPHEWVCANCGARHKRFDLRPRTWAGDARKGRT